MGCFGPQDEIIVQHGLGFISEDASSEGGGQVPYTAYTFC